MGHDRPDHLGAQWFTSSYSAANTQCVEVAVLPGRRLVRDSKLAAASPVLAVSPAAWSAFTTGVKAGHLNG